MKNHQTTAHRRCPQRASRSSKPRCRGYGDPDALSVCRREGRPADRMGRRWDEMGRRRGDEMRRRWGVEMRRQRTRSLGLLAHLIEAAPAAVLGFRRWRFREGLGALASIWCAIIDLGRGGGRFGALWWRKKRQRERRGGARDRKRRR